MFSSNLILSVCSLLCFHILCACANADLFVENEKSVVGIVVDSRSIASADLDGDGDIDIVYAGLGDNYGWFENAHGNGTVWLRHNFTERTFLVQQVAVAPLDGDCSPDILSAIGGSLGWHRNLGDGLFTDRMEFYSAAGKIGRVAVADLDGDGDLDVVFSHDSGAVKTLQWAQNYDGKGSFVPFKVISENIYGDIRYLDVGDFDSDNRTDVVICSNDVDEVVWFRNLGGGNDWSDPNVIASLNADHDPFGIVAVDIDNDGDKDLVLVVFDGDRLVWFENLFGNGSFSQEIFISEVNSPWAIHAADMDGDGNVDVLTESASLGRLYVFKNVLGKGRSWSKETFSTTTTDSRIVIPADVDGDGDFDAIAASISQIAWFSNSFCNAGGPSCIVDRDALCSTIQSDTVSESSKTSSFFASLTSSLSFPLSLSSLSTDTTSTAAPPAVSPQPSTSLPMSTSPSLSSVSGSFPLVPVVIAVAAVFVLIIFTILIYFMMGRQQQSVTIVQQQLAPVSGARTRSRQNSRRSRAHTKSSRSSSRVHSKENVYGDASSFQTSSAEEDYHRQGTISLPSP